MSKSLRLRLQLFHAAILTAALVLLGVAFYHQLRRSTMGEIDAELLSSARVLEGTLRGMSPLSAEELRRRVPLEIPPAIDRRPPPPAQERTGLPPSDQTRPGGLERQPRELTRDLPLTRMMDAESRVEAHPEAEQVPPEVWPDDSGGFGPPRPPPYFAIFAADGDLLRRSEFGDVPVAWTPTRWPLEYRNTDERREVLLRGPRSTLIVVGRNVEPELRGLAVARAQLVLISLAVLGLGSIGGWWLADNAIRPIQHISRTAEGINANNLAERIDTSSMDREFQLLATTLNSMLARIESAYDMQRQFTADASHDLRTPLAILHSHCELALSRPRSPEEYQVAIGTCLSAAGRMKSLVDGLLLLARSDAGACEHQQSQVDLQELTAETTELFRPYAAEHGVELQQVGQPATCSADRQALSQVIANLLDNAIVYSGQGGVVTLRTSCTSESVCLQVQDTGPGIPENAIPRIFDRFFRVDDTRMQRDGSSGYSGSGLGLSICKSIVEAHGGTLNVHSALTKGSLFEVRLPITRHQTEG